MKSEDDRLNPGRGSCDRVHVHQAEGVLDLCLDADPPDLEAHGPLDLREQQVQCDDVLGALHLRQHEAVEIGACTLDDRGHVAIGP